MAEIIAVHGGQRHGKVGVPRIQQTQWEQELHLALISLWHYDAGFTLRTYTHATRQKQDEAAQAMGSFMAQVM